MDRRNLEFRTLNDAVSDAQGLLAQGYEATGNWNLAQILGHCGDWLRFPIDGYPAPGFPMNGLLWLMKVSVGKSMRNKILRERRFKVGSPTLPSTVKLPNAADDAAALRNLEDLVKRFQRHTGDLHPSPLFGKMSRAEHEQLQIIHLQHHLSFLIPKS